MKAKRRQWKRETLAQKSTRANTIAPRLARSYPELQVPLHHRNTFELLIAVILSAQCTDEAVNRVTPELFRRYPDPASLAQAFHGGHRIYHSESGPVSCQGQIVERMRATVSGRIRRRRAGDDGGTDPACGGREKNRQCDSRSCLRYPRDHC